MDQDPAYIPFYDIYGEPTDSEAMYDLHIEDISDRSRGTGWHIEAHRHAKRFQILCIYCGRTHIKLDTRSEILEGINVVTVPVGVVHGFQFEADIEGVVITIREETLSHARDKNLHAFLQPIIEQPAVIRFDDDDMAVESLKTHVTQIKQEFQSIESAKNQSLNMLFLLILITLRRRLDAARLSEVPENSQTKILARFKTLIEQHYQEHLSVADYAKKLHISTSTLNRACQKGLKASAKTLVNARVISEAKRMLLYTRKPADQVAYSLGFKDPAYFSRYFKKEVGHSPGHYRTAHDQADFLS